MAREFGIRPWEIPLLTDGEVNAFVESLEHIADERQKRAGKAG